MSFSLEITHAKNCSINEINFIRIDLDNKNQLKSKCYGEHAAKSHDIVCLFRLSESKCI